MRISDGVMTVKRALPSVACADGALPGYPRSARCRPSAARHAHCPGYQRAQRWSRREVAWRAARAGKLPGKLKRPLMHYAVLYDTDCNICKTIMETLLTWDSGRDRLRPVPIQSDEGAQLLRDVPVDLRLESFHLVREDGTVVSGGPALATLFRQLPGGVVVARALEVSPDATATAYKWVALNRVKLSRFIPGAVKRLANRRLAARL